MIHLSIDAMTEEPTKVGIRDRILMGLAVLIIVTGITASSVILVNRSSSSSGAAPRFALAANSEPKPQL
jgi:hypothetical protein